jgi:hypothetical protein
LLPFFWVVVFNWSWPRSALVFSGSVSTSRGSSGFPFQGGPSCWCHTRTRTKLREGPKSYKRWVDHFPSVYRLSHAWASHFD